MKSPASPCNGVCRLHPTHGFCAGCWRSGDEIAAWPAMSDGAKRALLATLKKRRKR
ncbi:DUF1289 domain-containing protein [Novosphingobium sediminicola]|uniref:Putative Fe-S protein YdhL (DUF1289 family) n=1 Tax=Novosphingobium sediminicola TaxID=563162 RepID=A0A7W6CH13_9SPHN|nr:DUF1289 domain-containing protein [Novosphingobium sediminicola]MBB3954499.1 putative Fe-S protein YdhL (DUF1289 family) [Novosphingobium sediminicola]